MQLNLSAALDARYLWAFARDQTPPRRRYRPALQPRNHQQRYTITACSRQAKLHGVRVGMTYAEARRLVPGIRIIVTNR